MDEKIFAVVYDWHYFDEGGHDVIFVKGFEAAKKVAKDIIVENDNVCMERIGVYSTYFDGNCILHPDYASASLWSLEWSV